MKQPAEKPKILVVDDTPENVDVLAGILTEHYQIKVALNGRKALEIARSELALDLILLDVMMPEMDGYEVCSQLQADPKTRDIPVIFVTAKTEVEDEAKGFSLGAVDYIAKPISPSIVQARVKTQLALRTALTSIKELSDKYSRYISPQISQSIIEGKQDASIGSSRKKLSVFFSDIVGFTRQTDGMEPEDLAFILNSYLNRMAEVIMEHGGTLDKFIGDAILTFFGDPETRGPEGDALACLEMAMQMREAVTALNLEWESMAIPTGFQIRMGITTGFCTVGNFGSEQRMDYTIIGNQVNLASRLQAVSQPGELRIAHETWLLIRDHYDCTPQEPILVKGFERPVQTYIVNGIRGADGLSGKVEASCDGFSLALDTGKIKAEDRERVLARLQGAVEQLR